MERIFDILGIPPTDDKRKIKKAYALRVREVHPEEKPEEWEALHEAYRQALHYAAGGQLTESAGRTAEQEYTAFESEFTAEEVPFEEQKRDFDKEKGVVLAAARSFFRNVFQYDEDLEQDVSWGTDAYHQWLNFLNSWEFQRLRTEKEFWWMWFEEMDGKMLGHKTGVYVAEKLEETEEELRREGIGEDILRDIRQARQMSGLKPLKSKVYWKVIIGSVCGVIWIIATILKLIRIFTGTG